MMASSLFVVHSTKNISLDLLWSLKSIVDVHIHPILAIIKYISRLNSGDNVAVKFGKDSMEELVTKLISRAAFQTNLSLIHNPPPPLF